MGFGNKSETHAQIGYTQLKVQFTSDEDAEKGDGKIFNHSKFRLSDKGRAASAADQKKFLERKGKRFKKYTFWQWEQSCDFRC